MTPPAVTPASLIVDDHGLPGRWQGRARFVVLDTRFGLGHRFLALWNAWRRDPQRCERLHVLSFERHPSTRGDLERAHAGSDLADLARWLIDAWPPLTPNLHRLAFDDARVQLHLQLGDPAAGLRQCVARVDAFFLDDLATAPDPQRRDSPLMKSLARLAAPGATLACEGSAPNLREGLASVGFEVSVAPTQGASGETMLARFAPRFERRHPPARGSEPAVREPRALVIGAGLAGCAAAWALAEQGWRSTIFDRREQPAQEASGNPGGLFHGIVNPQDGIHARFNRAAALEAQRVVAQALARHGVAGSTAGLLRLHIGADRGQTAADMHAVLAQLGLPPDYVQACDAAQAGALCGWPLRHPAWFYPGGGWVDPAGLCRAYLERAALLARFAGGVDIQRLQRVDGGWQLHGAAGRVIDEAETVVLANAGDALRLLGAPPWPIGAVRGQISVVDVACAGVPLPRLPLSGAGYLLPEVAGQMVFGATSQPGDMTVDVRGADHAQNLLRLAELRGASAPLGPGELWGRVGWRWAANDRLPVIGAVPIAVPEELDSAAARRLDQPRFVPREPGLFVFTALGSRGITWSALGAQVLASAVCGAPSPVESDLLDAIDPARFVSRAIRQRGLR